MTRTDSDKLNLLNQFPFINISDVQNNDAKDFLQLNDQMQALTNQQMQSVKKKHPDYPISSFFHPKIIDDNFHALTVNVIKDLFSIYYDFTHFGNFDLFTNVEAFEEANQAQRDDEKRQALIDSFVSELAADKNNIDEDIKILVESIRFMTFKCIREYFMFYEHMFLK